MRCSKGITIYIDEVKFYDKPDLRQMWVLKGKEALVNTFRTGRDKVLYYGAYSPSDHNIFVQEVIEETSELTASFLITIRAKYPNRRIDVILDNAPWHFGIYVKTIAKKYKIHLHYLPPYSPDLNPIEPLWDWVRTEVTINQDYPSFVDKKNSLNGFFIQINERPLEIESRLVKKFEN
jgi:transposase